MRTSWKNRVALGVVLAALVFAATHNIRAELPQAIGTWASLGATPESRVGAAAVALKDGRTVIAGGSVDNVATDSVVAFDPNTGSFSIVGHLLLARVGHTATLLDDGRVLIAGGTAGDLISADLELFDPAAGVSVLGGVMAQPRTGHAAAKLADGKVLIVGGTSIDGVLQNAEVYDPETGTTTPTVLPMLSPRTGASATTLIDGRVLVAGGHNGTADLASAEIFEPSSQIFEAATTSLSFARSGHAAVLLPNNNSVLIAGGSSNGAPVPTSDLFLPAEFPDPYSYGMGSFAQTGDLIAARARAIASPHIEGYVVAMGGGAPEAEVYRFPTIKTDKYDYAPGELAVITGSGWEPDSEVTLLFQEDPAVHDDYVLYVPTDGEGNFSWDQWAPESHDINVRFYLLARDTKSRAQVTFTDSPRIASINALGPQTPNPLASSNGNTATFTVVPVRGNNGTVNAVFSVTSSLPTGVTASFSPNPPNGAFTANGNNAFPTNRILTFTTNGTTPAGSYPFTVQVADGGDLATQTGTLVVRPVKLAFTNVAFSGAVNDCLGPFVVQPQIGNNAVTNVISTTTVNLSTNQTGTFYSDVACSAAITTRTISNGTNTTGDFYYRATAVGSGTHTLTAADAAAVLTSATQAQTVAKANQTITFAALANKTYGDADFAVSATASSSLTVSFTSQTLGVCTVSGTTVHIVAQGSCTIRASQAGNSDYNAAPNVDQTFTINKADATIVVTPYTVPYDTAAHTATVTSITGVGGETGATVGTVDVSGTTHTNASTYASDSWTFTPTANYNTYGGSTTITDTINKADATIVVTPYTVPYDTAAHTATVTSITGVGGETGATVGTVDVSGTTHTNASTYASDSWSFTPTANYNTYGGSTTITDTINKADATIVVTPYTVPYDTAAHTATVTSITGVGGETGATVGTVDVSGTTHTNASTYASDSWSFTPTANYNTYGGSTTITDTINKADATIVVTPYTVPYDTAAHTATVTSITGVGGETGATVGTVDVSGTTHTNASTYASDSWSFTPTANYNTYGGSTTITDTINKADATIVVTPYTVPYDTAAHTATVTSITGVGGETGATVGTVDVSGTTHTNASTYASDSWTFTPTANYNTYGGSTTITDTINKADAMISVVGFSGVYDGSAHGVVSSSATGVNSEVLTGLVIDSTTYTNVPGGLVHWTFTNANYADQSGDATVTITQAPSATYVICPVTPQVYTGFPITACTATATAPDGLSVPLGVAYTNNVNPGTALASATYGGDGNHTGSVGNGSFTIVPPTVTNHPPHADDKWIDVTVNSHHDDDDYDDHHGHEEYDRRGHDGHGWEWDRDHHDGDHDGDDDDDDDDDREWEKHADKGDGVRITLTATDVDNLKLRFEIVAPPTHGLLSRIRKVNCTPDGHGGTTCTARVIFIPEPHFTGGAVFTYRAVEKDGLHQVSNTATVTVNLVLPFVTYSQGAWGVSPHGGNAGQFLKDQFPTLYPSGVIVGGAKTLKFTTAAKVKNFLPAGGKDGTLPSSVVDPSSTKAGAFAGDVLALEFNVRFSAGGLTRTGLGGLILNKGLLKGKTVLDVLGLANTVLGGNTGALNNALGTGKNIKLSDLSDIVERINQTFDGGKRDDGYLVAP